MISVPLFIASFPLSFLLLILVMILFVVIESIIENTFGYLEEKERFVAAAIGLGLFLLFICVIYIINEYEGSVLHKFADWVMEEPASDASRIEKKPHYFRMLFFLVIPILLSCLGLVFAIYEILRIVGYGFLLLMESICDRFSINAYVKGFGEDAIFGSAMIFSSMLAFIILYKGYLQPLEFSVIPAIFLLFSSGFIFVRWRA